MRYGSSRGLSAALIATLILLACLPSFARNGKKKVSVPKFDVSKLVWPSPPEQVRIRYLGEYNGELDLMGKKQIKGGMLERIAGVSVAPEERPRLVKPYWVATDSKDHIYVTDTTLHLVLVFDLEGKKVGFRRRPTPANL